MTTQVTLPMRLMLGAALLVLLAVTVAASLANVLGRKAPEIALLIAPWDAQAAGSLSTKLLLGNPRQRHRAAALADRALSKDPTNVAAVVTKGLISDLDGQRDAALRFFDYSQWLSRRNLETQLWWIEFGVARKDIKLALDHYDVALRTSRQAPDILFPILGSAISDAAIRRELATMMRSDTIWTDRFFSWLVTNGTNNRSAALLLADVQTGGRKVPPELFGELEQGLIDQHDYDAAWSFYRVQHPSARRDMSRDDRFEAVSARRYSPFEWNVVAEQGAASISRWEGRNVLAFTTEPVSGGSLAHQFLLLPTGHYQLQDDVRIESGPVESRPYWSLRCVDDRELGQTPFGRPATILKVPSDCPAQWLVLHSDAGDTIEGTTGVVLSVSLKPVN